MSALSQKFLCQVVPPSKCTLVFALPSNYVCISKGRQIVSSIRMCSSSGRVRKKIAPKRPRLGDNSAAEKSLDGVWYTSTRPPSSSNRDMGAYGLKRLDYTVIEVPRWRLPPHPP